MLAEREVEVVVKEGKSSKKNKLLKWLEPAPGNSRPGVSPLSPLIKSFLGTGLIKIISMPLGILASILLGRVLGPQSFGQYTFLVAFVTLLALPMEGGVGALITREVAHYAHANAWGRIRGVMFSATCWVLCMAVIIIALVFLVKNMFNLLPQNEKWDYLLISVLALPFIGLASVVNGAVRGLGYPSYAVLPVQLVRPGLFLLLVGGITWFGAMSIKQALWIQVFVVAATFLASSAIYRHCRPHSMSQAERITETWEWLLALFPFTLLTLVGVLNAQIGILLLGFLGTDEGVAGMRVAEQGSSLVIVSLLIAESVIAPHIVRAYKEGNKDHLQDLSLQASRGPLLIALPIGLVLIFFGKLLIQLAFGEKYVELAYWPLVILVVAQLFNVATGPVGQLLVMSGHEKDTLKGQGVALIINIAVCTILIPIWGAVGAAIGVAIGLGVWNIILGFLVFRRLGIRPSIF